MPGAPGKRIRFAEQGDLGCVKGGAKMHRGGVHAHQKRGAPDDRRQPEQIEPPGEIPPRRAQSGPDGLQVRPFKAVSSTSDHTWQPQHALAMVDHLRPTLRYPVFLGTRRSGMDDGKWPVNTRFQEELCHGFVGACREFQRDRYILPRDAQRLEQVEMVVDGVVLPNAGIDKLVEGELAVPRAFYPAKGDPARSAGKEGEKRGAVVAGKIQADIKFPRGQPGEQPRVDPAVAEYQHLIHVGQRRNEPLTVLQDAQCQTRTRERLAQCYQGGRRQDEIANALELEDEDVHLEVVQKNDTDAG